MDKPDKIDWDAQPLGNVRDVSIAQELGVSASMVSRARRDRGIRKFGIDWDAEPLGKVNDVVLAREQLVNPEEDIQSVLSNYTRGGARCHIADGNHYTMLAPPFVYDLADLIRELAGAGMDSAVTRTGAQWNHS